jgi:NAD(P)H-flavin reductase
MAKEALRRKKGNVKLLFGVRNEQDIMYDDYFKELSEAYPDFEIYCLLQNLLKTGLVKKAECRP